ncbi:MAG: N-acetyltransferase [Chloroflexi bacterium]|nr:N-acetyltransferase [Chloroflexota bacterium]
MKTSIRHEVESDYREVEELTREAFWNLYVPGCEEHYLVHKMRTHPDFIPELDFIAVHKNTIVGNIMFTKACIADEADNKVEITTFGPISVLPAYQRQGVGSALISLSRQIAMKMGYKAIVIHGHPHNYCKHGFKGSKDYSLGNAEGRFPYSLLVLELEKGFLEGHAWRYFESDVYSVDSMAAEEYDKLFEPKKKEYCYSQEEFHIASRAYIM